jgi:hypothetical protein
MFKQLYRLPFAILTAGVALGVVLSPYVRAQGLPDLPLWHPAQSAIMSACIGGVVAGFVALCFDVKLPRFTAIIIGLSLGYSVPELVVAIAMRWLAWPEYLRNAQLRIKSLRLAGPFIAVLLAAISVHRDWRFESRAGKFAMVGAIAGVVMTLIILQSGQLGPEFNALGHERNIMMISLGSIFCGLAGGMWIGATRNRTCGFDVIAGESTAL